MDNYSQLVERISSLSGLEGEEIERRVEAKRAKLSGLVSKEGAAQIVAAELGINFDQEKLKINQLVQGMRRANVIGKVIDVGPVREFNKNGRSGKVVNLLVADESSNVRVVLWDVHHISLIEKGGIKRGSVIEISNGNFRNGELHLGSFSDIKESNVKIGEVVESKVYGERKLSDVKSGESLMTRAVVVQMFEPRYFEVNAETGRKITVEDRANGVKATKRALLSVVLDDGSETLRAVMFGEIIKKLGFGDEEIFDLAKFGEKKGELLGEEKYFCGNVRNNEMYNSTDFIIEDVRDVDVDELVKELERKV